LSDAVGVGQYEDATPTVAAANLSRCEEARLCHIAQPRKLSCDSGKSQGDMTFDIFEEDPFGLDFADNARNLRPKVTGIVLAFALAGVSERLAWIAGREDMNAAAPWLAVERSKVAPDRRLCQGRVFHPCHESGRSMGFPLDVTDSSIGRLGNVEAEIEASIACAEGKAGKLLASANGGR
jgi:hypothetical protein